MKTILKLAFVLSVIVLSSCSKFQDVVVRKVEGAKIIKMGADGIEAELDVRLFNPNKYSFSIYKSDLDIDLNGTSLGKASISDKIKIKADAEDVYKVKIKTKFNSSSTFGLPALLALASSKTANIHIKGNIKAGKFFYKKRVPVDTKQKIPLSK